MKQRQPFRISAKGRAVILFNFRRWEEGSDLRVADPTRHKNGALKVSPKCCRAEASPLGVKVTIVEPGGFRTDFAGSSAKLA